MRDAYEVLHQKETELARVRREVASLRVVVPLLSSDSSDKSSEPESQSAEEDSADASADREATGTDGLSSFAASSRPNLWNVLKRGK